MTPPEEGSGIEAIFQPKASKVSGVRQAGL
jgi:hypothetical protein